MSDSNATCMCEQRLRTDLPNKAGLWGVLCNFGICWVFESTDFFGSVLAVLHNNRQLIWRNLLSFIWACFAGDLLAKCQPTCLKTEAQSALDEDPNLPEIYCLLVTHTSQGSLSTVMLMSSLLAVSRYCPVIVMMVPPAAGPLEGDTAMGTGSLKMGRKLFLLIFAHLQLPWELIFLHQTSFIKY